jgi:hypothetical protein
VRPIFCFIMVLMAAISASSASAQLDRLAAGALGAAAVRAIRGRPGKIYWPSKRSAAATCRAPSEGKHAGRRETIGDVIDRRDKRRCGSGSRIRNRII